MEIYNQFFEELVNLHPTINDALQISEFKHLKNKYENSVHPLFVMRAKDLYYRYLELINSKYKVNHYDNVLKYNLNLSLDYYNYSFNYFPITHQTNPITWFCENASGNHYYKFKTHKDYYDFIEKTEEFVLYLYTCICSMRQGISKNVTLPKVLAKLLLKQLESVIKNKPCNNNNVPKTLKVNFNAKINNLLEPIVLNLITFLKKEYIPNCRNTYGLSSLPNGRKMYRYRIKQFTSLDISVKEIHQYGISEINRIYNEMLNVKKILKFDGTLKQFNKYLLTRKDLKFKNKDDLIKSYRNEQANIIKNVLNKEFSDKISHNCIITSVPKYNEEFASAAYYIPGSIDLTRKGKFYMNARRLNEESRMDLHSLTLHEAIPGHHYQLTYMLDNDIPLFIKAGSGNETSFEEGWALYCENLGNYKTPESYYGKLNLEMIRALRLVLDTGIHYYNWTPKKCIDFSQKYLFDSRDEITKHVYRYMAIPGQALAYKLGERVFLNLRKKYVDSNLMTVKEFHHKCIRFGSMPISLLEESFKY